MRHPPSAETRTSVLTHTCDVQRAHILRQTALGVTEAYSVVWAHSYDPNAPQNGTCEAFFERAPWLHRMIS